MRVSPLLLSVVEFTKRPALYFLQRRCRATNNHDGGDCFFVPIRIVLFSSSIGLRDRTYTRFCVASWCKERHEVGLRLHHPLPRPCSRKAGTPPSPRLHRDHDRVSPPPPFAFVTPVTPPVCVSPAFCLSIPRSTHNFAEISVSSKSRPRIPSTRQGRRRQRKRQRQRPRSKKRLPVHPNSLFFLFAAVIQHDPTLG